MSSKRAVSPLELATLLQQGADKKESAGTDDVRYLAKYLRTVLPQKVANATDGSASQIRTLYDMGDCEYMLGVGMMDLEVRVDTMALVHESTESTNLN